MAKAVARESDEAEIAGSVLAGIIACGVIAGESDAEVADAEREALVEIVSGFVEGLGVEVDRDEVAQTAGELAQQVSDEGAESFLGHLRELLTDETQRRLGCLVAAAVTMADEEVTREEDATYYKIARALGFGRDAADEIWNEAAGEGEDDDADEDE